ncbi:unnamed protein product [Cochlearia groenlandica]
MEESEDMKFECRFCKKKFVNGSALGGHIRIHYSRNKNKTLINQRETVSMKHHQQQQQAIHCRECGQGFVSLKSLCDHMDCHNVTEKKIAMYKEEEEEVESSLITRKRSKSSSDSFSSLNHTFSPSSSSYAFSKMDQEVCDTSLKSQSMSREKDRNLAKKGDNFAVSRITDNLSNKSSTTRESCAVTKSKSADRSSDSKDLGLGHVCSFCNRVFESGQALGDHIKCHTIEKQEEEEEEEQRIITQQQTSTKRKLFDLNLSASDTEEE